VGRLSDEDLGHRARLRSAGGWHVDVEVAHERAGALVLDAREELTHDAEARGHDAAGRPRVHALTQHLHGEDAVDDATQGGGAPELLVVAAARVETDDEIRLADAAGGPLPIRPPIGAARLPAPLPAHHPTAP